MSIAANCSDCCTCAAGIRLERQTRVVGLNREYCAIVYGSGASARYFQTYSKRCYRATPLDSYVWSIALPGGDVIIDCSSSSSWPCVGEVSESGGVLTIKSRILSMPFERDVDMSYDGCEVTSSEGPFLHYIYHVEVTTYSDEISKTEALEPLSRLRERAIAALPAYGGWIAGSEVASLNYAPDEMSVAIRETRYRVRVKPSKVGSGKCMRVTWLERFVAEGGVPLSSVEIANPGVLRPQVTISAPPPGGVQARAVCVMDTVDRIRISSIRILNPGAGYATPPVVEVPLSTGWAATLAGGTVASITGGSATLFNTLTTTITGGDGSGASFAIRQTDVQGGAVAGNFAVGAGYTARPAVTPSNPGGVFTAPVLVAHLGVETPRCATWDGVLPAGYDEGDPTTWPLLTLPSGFRTLAVPMKEGTVALDDFRFICDCSDCP